MKIVRTVLEMQNISSQVKSTRKKIACVPTMGFFHEGHLSLMRKAGELGDIVVTTLFVNPLQFAPNEDLAAYPRDFERDCYLAEQVGVDYMFSPQPNEMYPTGYDAGIHIGGVTQTLEGESRPSHFDGVATVVAKLFNATLPDIAVFGQKDLQQTLVVKKMVRDLNFFVDIIIAPTMREQDGLAMSSRNSYLTESQRNEAVSLFQALSDAKSAIETGERNREKIIDIMTSRILKCGSFRIDYLECVSSDTLDKKADFEKGDEIALLAAVFLGKTRLIDNLLVNI